jgi:16S rRNA (guanine527-N7)-methyltransferase
VNAVKRISGPKEFAEVFDVSRETLARLETYEGLVKTWQKAVNLISPSTLGEIWPRHFADSAQLLRLAPDSARIWLDLGSGGGFPGLVLAILLAGREGAKMTLVESDARKAAFLGEVARKTGAPVEIYSDRIEKLATQAKSLQRDVITARALAPLPRLLEWVAPFFSPHTVAVLPKGKDAEAEVEEARKTWDFDCSLVPSLTDPDARIAVIRNLHARTEGRPRDNAQDLGNR